MCLDNNNHSVFKLYYHLILIVKYRLQVIDDAISIRCKAIFLLNITLHYWNGIMMVIIFIFYSKLTPIVNYQNLLMLIKVPVHVL